jgi:2-polyprenyl-3-methyl-5-hydroxy-6-metoxy-1,4-benzoquinol methylase
MINNKNKNSFQKCPICSNKNFKKIYNNNWQNSFFIKCKKCNLIFQNPQENFLDTINRYNEDYFNYELENQFIFFNLVKKTLDDFNIINLLPKNANVLEIGSATGLFLKYMDSLFFKSIGIELCKESVEYGKKAYGVNLVNGRLEDIKLKSESFDFIHFSHLIEHLNNPIDFLLNTYSLLKKNGYALLTTPNSSGLFAKYYKESWRCIVDDHLFIFNIKNLEKLLKKLNYKIIKYKTWGSIPKGKSNRVIKNFFDIFVKKTNLGDVICFLVQK